MKVLLSIKPEFAEKIFNGTKKYEYRRVIFKNKVETIVVYASDPVQRVIGEFEIGEILHKDIEQLWEYTGNKINATLLIPVFEKLKVTFSGGTTLQRFLNTHTVFFVHRKDNIYTASALLAYQFYKDSELQLQYTFIKDDSNLGIYAYDRNIYSAGVQIKF